MRADSFYEEFKVGLHFLGVSWGDKALVKVCVKKGHYFMAYGVHGFTWINPHERGPEDKPVVKKIRVVGD